jgi:cyanophycinase
MIATLCLQGGGPFTANDELDRRLLQGRGGNVVVLPTADAFEHPERLVNAATEWAQRVGVTVESPTVMRRADALETSTATVVRQAAAVYLVGDQPLHLRSVLKDTPVWDSIRQVLTDGGLVVACAGSAAGVCDPLVDPRGGAFTLGLGLITDLALVTTAEDWSHERLHRTLKLANTTVACLPTGSALVHTAAGWEQVGAVELHGELP